MSVSEFIRVSITMITSVYKVGRNTKWTMPTKHQTTRVLPRLCWRRSNFGAKLQAIKPSAVFIFARFRYLKNERICHNTFCRV